MAAAAFGLRVLFRAGMVATVATSVCSVALASTVTCRAGGEDGRSCTTCTASGTPNPAATRARSGAGQLRVAIVGAGVGGAHTAYRLKQLLEDDVQLTVFDGADRVGGRVRPVSVDGVTIEAGASILVRDNRYMREGAEEAGLIVEEPPHGPLGIWDANEFVYEEGSWGLFNNLAMMWRYGLDLKRVVEHVGEAVKRFGDIYVLQDAGQAFRTPEELCRAVKLYSHTQMSLVEYLTRHQVCAGDARVVHELINSVIRVNYNQPADEINALAGLVGMAPLSSGGGVVHTRGGRNEDIVKHFMTASKADLRLNTRVRSVTRTARGTWAVAFTDDSTHPPEEFDKVVLSAPLHASGITVHESSGAPPMAWQTDKYKREYKLTVATFVRGVVSPKLFNRPEGTKVPEMILTVENKTLPFVSFGLQAYGTDGKDNIYKVFSRHKLSSTDLDNLFTRHTHPISFPWRAYPRFQPPEEFLPFVLHDQGVYYTSAFELGASAMEVMAVSARNVALLIAHEAAAERARANQS